MAMATTRLKTTTPTDKCTTWLSQSYASAIQTSQTTTPPSTTEERKGNTYTFYNLNTSDDITTLVIRCLTDKFNLDAKALIYKIIKDTRFRSRYVVTFNKKEHFDILVNTGITINGTKIKGKADMPVRFYLPNMPCYCDEADVRKALQNHQVIYVKQKVDPVFKIPTGGWNIGLRDSKKEHFNVYFEGEMFRVICCERDRRHLGNVAHQHVADKPATANDGIANTTKTDVDFQKTQENNTDSQNSNSSTVKDVEKKSDSPPTDQTNVPCGEDDPLCLNFDEASKLKSLVAKGGNLNQKDLESKIELQNRLTCTSPSTTVSMFLDPSKDFESLLPTTNVPLDELFGGISDDSSQSSHDTVTSTASKRQRQSSSDESGKSELSKSSKKRHKQLSK